MSRSTKINQRVDGLDSPEAIENLVIQICYRAADLGLLLHNKSHHLSQYSRHLRKEPDTEYYEGYLEEPELFKAAVSSFIEQFIKAYSPGLSSNHD